MTYDQFWLRYLRAHARPETRAIHYAGSSLAILAILRAVWRRDWRWLLAAPAIGYGCAWGAHYGIEHNRPETFGHPVWSLLSDFRMASLAASGRLAPHLARAGVA